MNEAWLINIIINKVWYGLIGRPGQIKQVVEGTPIIVDGR